jgi:glycopeptide antibiotics resistance protein
LSQPDQTDRRIVSSAVRRSLLPLALLALYIAVLLALTMAPNPRPTMQLVNLIPFKSILAGIRRGGWLLNVNVIGNIVVFMPLGLLIPLLGRRLSAAGAVLWAGLLLSTSIEVLQWLFARRVADIDDVILNSTGALIGYACYLLTRPVSASPEDSAET